MGFGLLKDILKRAFGEIKDHKNTDQIQVNCPHCAKLYNDYEPDNKYNLEINLTKQVYKCWKCEISGPIPKLLKYYSRRELYEFYNENFDGIDFTINKDYEEDDDDIYREVILPKEFIPFTEMDTNLFSHHEAYNYIKHVRKISDNLISELNIGFCLDGYYKNRILIPSYDINRKLNYFITRTYINHPITYIKPKITQDFIFNEYRLDWNSVVYVVEGGFDYTTIPINTLCLMGKEFIPHVFNMIIKYKPQLVFLLDPDAMKQTIKHINMFNNIYVNDIRYLEIDNNMDIDEIRKEIGEYNLSKYIIKNTKKLTDEDIINYQ